MGISPPPQGTILRLALQEKQNLPQTGTVLHLSQPGIEWYPTFFLFRQITSHKISLLQFNSDNDKKLIFPLDINITVDG
jgi:hypothetical protein